MHFISSRLRSEGASVTSDPKTWIECSCMYAQESYSYTQYVISDFIAISDKSINLLHQRPVGQKKSTHYHLEHTRGLRASFATGNKPGDRKPSCRHLQNPESLRWSHRLSSTEFEDKIIIRQVWVHVNEYSQVWENYVMGLISRMAKISSLHKCILFSENIYKSLPITKLFELCTNQVTPDSKPEVNYLQKND